MCGAWTALNEAEHCQKHKICRSEMSVKKSPLTEKAIELHYLAGEKVRVSIHDKHWFFVRSGVSSRIISSTILVPSISFV